MRKFLPFLTRNFDLLGISCEFFLISYIVMKKFFNLKTAFCNLFLFAALLFSVTGCAEKQPDLFSYVSELRDNVLIAELPCADDNGGNSGESKALLTVYSYLREQPYLDDGAAGTTERIAAFYFTRKDGSSTFPYSFTAQGGENKESGGEMSYDDVKKQYYYMCFARFISNGGTARDGEKRKNRQRICLYRKNREIGKHPFAPGGIIGFRKRGKPNARAFETRRRF